MGTGFYVEGPPDSGKTRRLITEAHRLLSENTTTSVLILCSNHARQRQFINRLAHVLHTPAAQWPIYTYAGYARTMIFNHWPSVEKQIQDSIKTGTARIRPALSGMEDTELIVSYLIDRFKATHPEAFTEFPGNTRHLARQLIRRIRLRSENLLTRAEMSERSLLLNEICQSDVSELEKQFDWTSYAIRTLDANKQLDVFHRLLETPETSENSVLKNELAQIKHLIVDDVDETIPAQQAFIKTLAPQLETLVLAADVDGGSRRGYLNAFPYGWPELKELLPGKTETLTRDDVIATTAQALLVNWKTNPAPRLLPSDVVSMHDDSIARVEMLDAVTDDILRHVQAGGSPGDLCVVFPKTDVLSFYRLKNRLSRKGIPVQLLSGTHRPADNPVCRAFIYLLQLANGKRWSVKLTPWEMKTVLIRILQCPVHERERIEQLAHAMLNLDNLSSKDEIIPALEKLPLSENAFFTERYQKLQAWLARAQTLPFEKQLHSAFGQLIATAASESDRFSDLSQIIESHERQKTVFQSLNAVQNNVSDIDYDRWWLQQIKNGSIANTPEMPDEINPDAVVTGTPQKLIDFEVRRPVQLWLDVASREWARSDNAPLYNAWVHSAVWDFSNTAFSEEFNEQVIRARAGHITRTLAMRAGQKIRAYASDLDDLGFTHTGLLKPLLITDAQPAEHAERQQIILRDDQRPILDYESGTMAITAVPGAGKTFVNVALILGLIQKGTPADEILVLTYMDSAAKTLLGRLKKQLAGISDKLPSASTIHSLAFRILTENDHALLLNMSVDDMTILDDYQRAEVLQHVAGQTMPQTVKSTAGWSGAVDRAISHAKSLGISAHDVAHAVERSPANFRLAEFLPAYKLYEETLRENGFLDFTDLIVKAIFVLEGYPDIRARYQQQFKIIIEDEAQDSSKLLQRFITLIGGDNPNLIRTGDTNQSITTTFSSADTSVFRKFIASADKTVAMDRSSRCAPEVINLANRWVRLCSQTPALENAFQPVDILPVADANPDLLYPVTAQAFVLSNEEDAWLAETIKHIKEENPDATVAVLARSNSQVNHLTSVLHNAKIAAVSHSEQLNLNPVFQMVLNLLKLLEAPGDLARQFAWYETLVQTHLIEHTIENKTFFETETLAYKHPSELADQTLMQLYYDILEYSNDAAGGNIPTLIVKIIDRFFTSVEDKSNGYLCALMAEEVLAQYDDTGDVSSPLETVISRFDDLRRSFRGKKSFSELLTRHPARFVHVMSLHKSKGQEFDIVLMPYLQKDSFPHEVAQIRFDETDKLQQELERVALYKATTTDKLSENYIEQKKLEKIEEEARLIYVGLTRAKRGLYLSCHAQAFTKYGKLRPVEAAFAFAQLEKILKAEEQGRSGAHPEGEVAVG